MDEKNFGKQQRLNEELGDVIHQLQEGLSMM